MSKRRIAVLVLIIVLIAGLTTSATYFVVRSGQSLSCSGAPNINNETTVPAGKSSDLPPDVTPIDELAINAQKLHGYPQWFYKESVSQSCFIPDTSDPDTSSNFSAKAMLNDFAIWGLAAVVIVVVAVKVRSRGRR